MNKKYTDQVKKLCRMIETDFDNSEYVRYKAKKVFAATENHIKKIQQLKQSKAQAIKEVAAGCDEFKKSGIKSYEAEITALKKEVERLKGGWISVDDRLPPDNVEIDFNDKYSGVICGMYGKHYLANKSGFVFYDLQDEQPSLYYHVTHWRERPEPPGDV